MMVFDYKNQSEEFWRQVLSDERYKICRQRGTEIAGTGEYDKFYEKGAYYCACCGGDYLLFSSAAKYDSGTGWPSFFNYEPGGIEERPDPDDTLRGFFGMQRTEVICARCHSHLGHVFEDGPKPTGRRYCMNSIALIFVGSGKLPKRLFEVDDNDQN